MQNIQRTENMGFADKRSDEQHPGPEHISTIIERVVEKILKKGHNEKENNIRSDEISRH